MLGLRSVKSMKRIDRLIREQPRPCMDCGTTVIDMRKWPLCAKCEAAALTHQRFEKLDVQSHTVQ